ncbi:uroporphyrinogen-III synthase [Phlyctema vagabunda]|uniref:Uroporphyrinogen-III synthase n=1 Tax=Phlyctema vagabunda TaxID=108571 RepID=A0ABR4PS78_9HELO
MTQKSAKPDAGTPILLLKTKSTPNDGYEERFSADGSFEPTFVPVFEHRLLEEGLNVVRDALKSKDISKSARAQYGGMIFTSQRAVEAFSKLVDEGKGTNSDWPYLQEVPIYTVGPATSRALRAVPQSPPLNIFGADTGNGEALAHYMLDHYGQWYADRNINPALLFLVGEQRRDIIPKTLMDPALPEGKQMKVVEQVVYGTGEMESFEQDFAAILKETESRPLRWVTVFSPTGCGAMLRALGMLDKATGKYNGVKKSNTFVVTIGPTTRDYLIKTFGYEPDVCAARPSPEGIEEGIREFVKNHEI